MFLARPNARRDDAHASGQLRDETLIQRLLLFTRRRNIIKDTYARPLYQRLGNLKHYAAFLLHISVEQRVVGDAMRVWAGLIGSIMLADHKLRLLS